MTTLDATQEAHLKAFENAYVVFKEAEHVLEATLRERLATELESLRIDASKAANRAVAAGVPISRLGDKARRGMRTRNFNTIRAFLDLTESNDLREPADFDPRATALVHLEFDPESNRYRATRPGDTESWWLSTTGSQAFDFDEGGSPILPPADWDDWHRNNFLAIKEYVQDLELKRK